MNYSKCKSILIALEGFIVSIAAHAAGGYYFAPLLAERFPQLFFSNIMMLSSSAISPLIAIVYLAVRVKFFPKVSINKRVLTYLLSGVIMAWIIAFTSVLLWGMGTPFELKVPHPYYYLNLLLIVLWIPILEEILNRGYFFEILRQDWGDKIALLFSSILFVLLHGIWGRIDMSLIFIFLYSVIFTLVYMKGGLIASIGAHSFVNLYLAYLTST